MNNDFMNLNNVNRENGAQRRHGVNRRVRRVVQRRNGDVVVEQEDLVEIDQVNQGGAPNLMPQAPPANNLRLLAAGGDGAPIDQAGNFNAEIYYPQPPTHVWDFNDHDPAAAGAGRRVINLPLFTRFTSSSTHLTSILTGTAAACSAVFYVTHPHVYLMSELCKNACIALSTGLGVSAYLGGIRTMTQFDRPDGMELPPVEQWLPIFRFTNELAFVSATILAVRDSGLAIGSSRLERGEVESWILRNSFTHWLSVDVDASAYNALLRRYTFNLPSDNLHANMGNWLFTHPETRHVGRRILHDTVDVAHQTIMFLHDRRCRQGPAREPNRLPRSGFN